MTHAEILVERLIQIEYTHEQAIDLVEMYAENNNLSKLEDYIKSNEN